MSAHLEPSVRPVPAGGSPDRSVGVLVAAGVLVVAVVAAVLLFGVQRPPALPALADEPVPAPPAAVAWTSWRDGACVHVGETTGGAREVWCSDTGADLGGWTEEGDLLVTSWDDGGERRLVIDAASGAVLTAEPLAQDRLEHDRTDPSSVGEPVARAHRSDGDLVVEEPPGQEIWRVTSPASYELRASSVSPDGRWLAAVDTADRLLLLSVDGSAPARVWATDVDTGMQPVWEGG